MSYPDAQEYTEQILQVLGLSGSYEEIKRREKEVERIVQAAIDEAREYQRENPR